MANVKIGPSFFKNEFREYSNWRAAYVREALQNCLDAPGSNKVNITIVAAGENTLMVFENNGEPMTQDILVNKLLALGETGKNFVGTVGGFGKAKNLLLFCHESYKIRTGVHEIVGRGGEYDLSSDLENFHGTRSEVLMAGDQVSRLSDEVKRFASYAQWPGTITLNGETRTCNLHKGSPRKEYDWGTIYTNKSIPHRVIVRMNGIPMFSHHTDLNRTVIIELKGSSVDVLTANRDSLRHQFAEEFDQFLTDLTTNKSKALKAKKPVYKSFSGAKYAHRKLNVRQLVDLPTYGKQLAKERGVNPDSPPPTAVLARQAAGTDDGTHGVYADQSRIGVLERSCALATTGSSSQAAAVLTETAPVAPVSTIAEFFVIKNETTMQIPDYYQPDSDQFGSYGKKLARIWGRLLLELHRLYEVETEFGIGFVFDDEALAQRETTNEYGTVYYLNPAMIVQQKASKSQSFKKRHKLTDRNTLLAIAAHEFVHHFADSHNEEYAGKFTEVMGRVLDARKDFNWCFGS